MTWFLIKIKLNRTEYINMLQIIVSRDRPRGAEYPSVNAKDSPTREIRA